MSIARQYTKVHTELAKLARLAEREVAPSDPGDRRADEVQAIVTCLQLVLPHEEMARSILRALNTLKVRKYRARKKVPLRG